MFKKHTKRIKMSPLFSAEVATALKLHKLSNRTYQIQPCSAKTGEGVRDGLEWALKQIKSVKSK